MEHGQDRQAATHQHIPNTPKDPADLLTQLSAEEAAAELLNETIVLEQQRLDMRRRMNRIAELLDIVSVRPKSEIVRKGFTQ
jgi:hypothetical protein